MQACRTASGGAQSWFGTRAAKHGGCIQRRAVSVCLSSGERVVPGWPGEGMRGGARGSKGMSGFLESRDARKTHRHARPVGGRWRHKDARQQTLPSTVERGRRRANGSLCRQAASCQFNPHRVLGVGNASADGKAGSGMVSSWLGAWRDAKTIGRPKKEHAVTSAPGARLVYFVGGAAGDMNEDRWSVGAVRCSGRVDKTSMHERQIPR